MAGIGRPAAMYGWTVAAKNRHFAMPYPRGKAITRASANPSKLSSIVTSALLRNNPDAIPAVKVEKTAPGAGKYRLLTCPKVVLTYQLANRNRASRMGGTIN